MSSRRAAHSGSDGRLGNAEPGGDGPEGLPAVGLERFDDPLVQAIDPRGRADGAPARLGHGRLRDRSTQSEAIRTMRCASGQRRPLLELALRMLDAPLANHPGEEWKWLEHRWHSASRTRSGRSWKAGRPGASFKRRRRQEPLAEPDYGVLPSLVSAATPDRVSGRPRRLTCAYR